MDWVKDEDVKSCMRCNVPFTALRRRHHCRICKKVFCDSCSSQRLPLNNVMERVCKDCFAVEKGKRDQWELITNCGFCSPCGKHVQYPDFGCMLKEDGCWSCREKPYMVLDLEKKIWTVKMDELIYPLEMIHRIKEVVEKQEEKKVEEVKPKSRASSISSTTSHVHKERVTFKDIVSGNISEEVLKASTIPSSQEKVYELERVDGSCQTEEQPVVSIPPVVYLTLSSEEIAHLQDCSPEVEGEVEEPLPIIKETNLAVFPERSDIIKLTSAVTESSKLYRQRLSLVTERRALRKEEDEDERDVKEAREQRLQKLMSDNSLAVDESRMILDNLVCNYQSLSSRFNKMKGHQIAVNEAIPDMEGKVRSAQEQFQTLSHDSLMEIAAQQLVHLQQFRSLSSSYRTMYNEEKEFADDCMSILMDQQESVNQCLNKCISTVSSLLSEFETIRERCSELEMRVKRNEESADKTIEEAAETIQAAEKLSFLSEQQLFDMEKQYRLQEKRLIEVQTMLQLKESENRKLKEQMRELKIIQMKEDQRREKELVEEQWRVVEPPVGERATQEETEDMHRCEMDMNQLHLFLKQWSQNKSQHYLNDVEEWVERVISGRNVEVDNNTIQINLFTLEQRDVFLKNILPFIWNRKNVDCVVQEHKREEFDYRITVLNNNEAIPAISVPSNQELRKPEENKLEATEFEFMQKESEEEEDDLRQSDLDVINRVVLNSPRIQQTDGKKKRKVKHKQMAFFALAILCLPLYFVYVWVYLLQSDFPKTEEFRVESFRLRIYEGKDVFPTNAHWENQTREGMQNRTNRSVIKQHPFDIKLNASRASNVIHQEPTLRKTILPIPLLKNRPDDISSLGFNYSSYYRVNNSQPIHIDLPKTKWITGNDKFKEYMNNVFIPHQQQHSLNTTTQIIYLKRGTTGIAGQMSGMCDVLLLAILNNRVFQYHAPAILPHFFDFPIFNMSYPVRLENNTEFERLYNKGLNIRETTDYFIDYDNVNRDYSGIFKDGDLNVLYPGSLVIASLHMFTKRVLRVDSFYQRLASLQEGIPYAEKVLNSNWYNVCTQSLFQPSAYTMQFIKPYLDLFKGHRVLGVHVRSGGYANWEDGSYFKVTPQVVKKQSRKIHDLLAKSSKSLLFLSTDSDVIEAAIRKRFASRLITVTSLPRAHVGKDPTEEGLLRSIVDLYLLGQCDDLLLTRRSGFSAMALALNGKNPSVSYFSVKYKCICLFSQTIPYKL